MFKTFYNFPKLFDQQSLSTFHVRWACDYDRKLQRDLCYIVNHDKVMKCDTPQKNGYFEGNSFSFWLNILEMFLCYFQTSTNVKCEMVCAQEEPVRTWMEASNACVEMDLQFLPAENDA